MQSNYPSAQHRKGSEKRLTREGLDDPHEMLSKCWSTENMLIKRTVGIPWGLSGLRIQHCHCIGSDCCCGPGTSTCCGCGKKKKKKKKKKERNVDIGAGLV